MSSKIKKKPYKFTFQTVIRLVIFSVIIFFLITLLSQSDKKIVSQDDPTVLGEEVTSISTPPKINIHLDELYQKIPEDSRQKIENLNKNPAVTYFQDKFNYLKSQSNGFPQKQIKDIKKILLKNAYDDMVKSIDQE